MTRKFLNEIGINGICLSPGDSREKKYKNYEEKYGVFPPDCWDLDYTMLCYLYERLLQYKRDACVDLTYHKFTFDGKEYTQEELIDEMIEIAEFVLMDLDKVSKRTKTYKRLTSNKYYIKYGEFNSFDDEQFNIRGNFWKIWAIIYPAMWW